MMQFKLTGETELARAIDGLPARISGVAAFEALVIALLPLVEAAKMHAPVRFGDLRQSIGFVVKRYRRGGMLLGLVGPVRGMGTDGREPANYGHLVEFGHRIAEGGKLDRLDGGHVKRGVFETKGSSAGFVPGEPFLTPAWEEKKDEVLAVLRREFGARLEAAVTRRRGHVASMFRQPDATPFWPEQAVAA